MKLVIQNTSRVWGGNEKWLATLAAGLIDRGHSVVVSCASGPVQHELIARRIPTSPFRPRGAIDFVSGFTFAGWLARERPDVLLLTSWRPTAWAAAGARMAGVTRVVVRLGIVRDYPARTPRGLALRKVHALIVNSEEIRGRWLATAPFFSPEAVHVVLNGVRTRRSDRAALRKHLRSETGCDDDTILIGGAGHIAPRKGFDVLLHAFKSAAIPASRVVILGGGDHRPHLESLARDLNLTDRVTWLGHRPDGAAVIAGLDLFVLSSHNEGMANVMLEAMAGGTPVIASDISGVRRAIGASASRPTAGWIVPPGDADALAAGIRTACEAIRQDAQGVERLADEAHWRAENWFSPARMVDECEKILFGA
ncbi:MAG: glycosyltransferase [Gemmatimonadaceae bacterium]